MTSHILSVGQCNADDSRLAHVLQIEADAHMDRASNPRSALQLIAQRQYDLVLVNRIFDGTGDSGIDFIGELRKTQNAPCAMLISDYPEAQAAAAENGALPGFGKSALHTPEVAQRLREAIHSCSRAGKEIVK